jgi:hypothetical protein
MFSEIAVLQQDGDRVSFLDCCQHIKELTRYMSEHEKLELKNFAEQCEDASIKL